MDALERTLQPTRRVLGDVDPAQPLDTTHPLLRGVQGFWLPLPRHVGGSQLYDLSPNPNHASQVNSTSWGYDSDYLHPAAEYNTNGYHQHNSPELYPPDLTTTIVTTYTGDTSSFEGLYGKGQGDNGNRLYLYANYNGEWTLWNGEQDFGDAVLGQSVVGELTVLTIFASTTNGNKGWKDGEQSFSKTKDWELPDNNHQTTIGQRPGGFNYDGRIHAVIEHSRELSGAEVKRLHSQARRGFPDLLRRRSDVGLLGGGGGTTVSLATTELQHTHTLESTSVSAIYSLSTDELQQPHALGSPSVSVGYSLTTSELQQAHALESPSLAIAGLLTPEDARHGHTVESTLTDVQFALTTDALQQTHTLGAGGVDVAYALTPQGLQHLHSLAPSTLEAIFGLTPEDLSQAHTIESPSGSGLVILSVDGMTHPHRLGQVTLGTVGFATKIDVSASPIYDTDSRAEELYQITLNATPILE